MIVTQTLGFGPEVDLGISFGVGALALFILAALMIALVAFGGGREHS
jgi:hypothetical protein